MTRTHALWFAAPAPDPAPATPRMKKPPRTKRPAVKIDPAYLSAARELRDRWMERVNAGDAAAVLAQGCIAKYDVARRIAAAPARPAIPPEP